MSKKCVVVAGGTGGHIFPGIAVADYLKAQGWQVTWIGTPDRMEASVVPKHNIEIDFINVKGVRGNGLKRLVKAPFMVINAILQARKVLKNQRPDVVLAMGGYVTGPTGIAAKSLGIPLVIHEQNAIPGLTNRWLAKVANQVLSAFPNSFDRKDVIVCGNPVRKEISEIAEPETRLTGRQGNVRILIVGGSLGALSLNKIVPLALAKLSQTIDIRHQAGRAKLALVEQAYTVENIKAESSEFITDMAEAYEWADLVICRAGALTIAELAAVGVASVLVPYPYAVDDHQTKNAEFLVDVGAAKLMPESDMTVDSLSDLISELLVSKNTLIKMAVAARLVAMTDAADIVANHCSEVAL
jgi:UDP-N-acetylglucosamine--N-acetylmuramyl-(pentapeptide) pyrophosphoryl-undecaprenol N-acetylglucosamine transferase